MIHCSCMFITSLHLLLPFKNRNLENPFSYLSLSLSALEEIQSLPCKSLSSSSSLSLVSLFTFYDYFILGFAFSEVRCIKVPIFWICFLGFDF